jgi:hypothetical protein
MRARLASEIMRGQNKAARKCTKTLPGQVAATMLIAMSFQWE